MSSLVCVAVGAILVWFFWLRREPERLLDLDEAIPDFSISAGTLYWPAYKDAWYQKGPQILARPLGGGAQRTVIADDSKQRFAVPDCFAVNGETLIYGISPQGEGGIPSPSGHLTPQEYMQATHPVARVQARGALPIPVGTSPMGSVLVTTVHFRSVYVKGGAPRDLVTVHGRSVCLVGDHVFWIRPQPKTRSGIANSRQLPLRPTWKGDLMLTSLSDGSARVVRTGCPDDAALSGGETGVFWTEPRATGDVTRNIFFCRVTAGVPRYLHSVEADQTAKWSTEHLGRLFWFEADYGHATGNRDGALMSANLDGSGVQKHFSLAALRRGFVSGRNLHSYHGELYCLLTDKFTVPLDDTEPPACLCRLYLDRTQPIKVLWRLPSRVSQFHFEEGYLDFIWWGRRRRPWATFASENANPGDRSTLFRVPLKP